MHVQGLLVVTEELLDWLELAVVTEELLDWLELVVDDTVKCLAENHMCLGWKI